MKTTLRNSEVPLRKFPSKAIWFYLAVQVLMGLVVSSASFGDYQLAHILFAPIDAALPTFRTWFVQSNDPIGCKVLLLFWWLVFIPWGVIWYGRFTQGFRVLNPQAFPSGRSRLIFLAIGLFFSVLFIYGHALMDQTSSFTSSSLKSGIGSIVPFVIKAGPVYFAYYLAATSIIAVTATSLLLVLIREPFLSK